MNSAIAALVGWVEATKPNICESYTPLIHLANFEMGRSGLGNLRGDRNWGKERSCYES
jgi:hypothetical protein